MSSETVIKLFQNLPLEFQKEVIHFMEFLSFKVKKTTVGPKQQKASLFGHAKGKIYVAPDFDEPLDDFKDYM